MGLPRPESSAWCLWRPQLLPLPDSHQGQVSPRQMHQAPEPEPMPMQVLCRCGVDDWAATQPLLASIMAGGEPPAAAGHPPVLHSPTGSQVTQLQGLEPPICRSCLHRGVGALQLQGWLAGQGTHTWTLMLAGGGLAAGNRLAARSVAPRVQHSWWAEPTPYPQDIGGGQARQVGTPRLPSCFCLPQDLRASFHMCCAREAPTASLCPFSLAGEGTAQGLSTQGGIWLFCKPGSSKYGHGP